MDRSGDMTVYSIEEVKIVVIGAASTSKSFFHKVVMCRKKLFGWNLVHADEIRGEFGWFATT